MLVAGVLKRQPDEPQKLAPRMRLVGSNPTSGTNSRADDQRLGGFAFGAAAAFSAAPIRTSVTVLTLSFSM